MRSRDAIHLLTHTNHVISSRTPTIIEKAFPARMRGRYGAVMQTGAPFGIVLASHSTALKLVGPPLVELAPGHKVACHFAGELHQPLVDTVAHQLGQLLARRLPWRA